MAATARAAWESAAASSAPTSCTSLNSSPGTGDPAERRLAQRGRCHDARSRKAGIDLREGAVRKRRRGSWAGARGRTAPAEWQLARDRRGEAAVTFAITVGPASGAVARRYATRYLIVYW